MARTIRNPFYWVLVVACALLLATMFVYLVGWYYVPGPDTSEPAVPMPGWMRWIDRHALQLIVIEVSAIVVLGCLTIGLDRFFEPRPPADSPDREVKP